MFSKEVIDGLTWVFHEKFDGLRKKDKSMKDSIEELLTLIGSNVTIPKELSVDIEDAVNALINDSSCLGYFIGLNDGADMMNSLMQPDLPERLLKARGELLE
ncbi:MAG: hypothetical protein APF81_15750 [Desulfosporosinus sp. BRH_c37]|nr:MAG: hypothetical protein APF81_15750 [Desulfosporosinus sp. BRH_c37]